jgi:hypothetical protein
MNVDSYYSCNLHKYTRRVKRGGASRLNGRLWAWIMTFQPIPLLSAHLTIVSFYCFHFIVEMASTGSLTKLLRGMQTVNRVTLRNVVMSSWNCEIWDSQRHECKVWVRLSSMIRRRVVWYIVCNHVVLQISEWGGGAGFQRCVRD